MTALTNERIAELAEKHEHAFAQYGGEADRDCASALRELLRTREGWRDALRYRWLRQFIRVQANEPGSWTRWIVLECIPYRSESEDAEELLDELIERFPLAAIAAPNQE